MHHGNGHPRSAGHRAAPLSTPVEVIPQYITGARKYTGGTLITALLVYYSEFSRDRLELELRSRGIEVHPISGRAADAVDSVRMHPADVVVVDKDAADISITQTVRQIAHILPRSLIFTAGASPQDVDVYRKGRRVGTVDIGEIRSGLQATW